ncbi:MAG: exopolyphosphatase [Myxococcaceae bacterium]|nr:exopolyphosphatase [Myxococcaceae bacterium]
MPRFASIDIGTNSVLLLVAERGADGRFAAVLERAEITRLGRGVDQSKTLAPDAIETTLQVLERYATEARGLGAQAIAATATSAARDASNGAEFLRAVAERTGVKVEIITGEEEARLSFASAWADFGGAGPLVVLDIGGGSTEFIYGDGAGEVTFRRSFDIGSVRLTERWIRSDPPSAAERATITTHLDQTFAQLPAPPVGAHLVGVAGTVTTICAVARAIDPYDAAKVHGARLPATEISATLERLCALPLAERRTLPGLQPKRADVIPAGAMILEAAARRLSANEVRVSDRGLRWGLLVDRFGRLG